MTSLDCPFDRALRASHLSLEKATETSNWVPHIWWSSQKQGLQPKFQIPDSEIVILAKGIPPSSILYCVVVYKAFSVLVGCGYKTIIQRSYICIYFVFHTSPQSHVFLSPKCSIKKKKSVGSMYVKKEESEREKKGKCIERKKLINHTTKKWEAVNRIMPIQFCDLWKLKALWEWRSR